MERLLQLLALSLKKIINYAVVSLLISSCNNIPTNLKMCKVREVFSHQLLIFKVLTLNVCTENLH